MVSDPEQDTRFLGNRIMMEISLGRRLTTTEQKRLYAKSTKRLEVELFGGPLDVDLRELRV